MAIVRKNVLKIAIYSVTYCVLNPLLFLLIYRIFPNELGLQALYYWTIFNLLFPIIPIVVVSIFTVNSKNDSTRHKENIYLLIYLIVLYIGIIYFFTNGFKYIPMS